MAGTYTVKGYYIQTGCTIDMNGQAVIAVTNNPLAFNVTGGGEQCNDGIGMLVGLSGSEDGVIYNLFRNSVAYGDPVTGTGSAINFGYINQSGTYTAVANRLGCTTNMLGSVNIVIKPNPINYNVLVNNLNVNNKAICGGETLTIGLSDTEQGVLYSLQVNNAEIGAALTGTGDAMSFPVINQPFGGTYKVNANKNGCVAQIDQDVIITVNPLPVVYNVTGGGEICVGDNPVQIAVSGSEANTTYQLFKNEIPFGGAVQGTGAALVLASLAEAGTYTVVANQNGCTLAMNGNAVIIVKPLPQLFNITSTGSTNCSSTGIDILLSSSEQGISYTLLFNGNPVGNPLIGTGSQISFGIYSDEGIYTIRGNKNGCVAMMNGMINLRIDDPPVAYNLTGGGLICGDEAGLILTLSDSELGVEYQVKLNGNNIGTPVQATGNPLQFGPFNLAGTYTVVGSSDGCDTEMNGNALIVTSPKPVVTISGPDEIVQQTTGTYTANVENGVNYLWSVAGGTVTGANNQATVNILWGAAGNGVVTLRKTYALSGCFDEADYNVTILDVAVPSIQARGLIFSSVTQNSMMLRWTNGNGTARIVVAYPGDVVTANPQVGV